MKKKGEMQNKQIEKDQLVQKKIDDDNPQETARSIRPSYRKMLSQEEQDDLQLSDSQRQQNN